MRQTNVFLRLLCRTFLLAALFTLCGQTPSLADDQGTTNQPARLTPVTVYGGDYDVLPGAASVTVLDTEPVQGGALASTRDLSALAPNSVVFDGNDNRVPRFSIRGLRENNFVTGDPAVGLYLDDVPFFDLYSRSLVLHDVESVEFVRGPQGTLYGASGPGGVINIVSHQPTDVWRGTGNFTYGDYEQMALDAAVRGPIVSNRLAFSIAGLYSSRDGFVENTFNGNHPDDQKTLSGRAQLRWTPTANWDFSLIAMGQKFDDGFVPTFNPASDRDMFHVARNYDGYVDTRTWDTSLKAAYETASVKFTSVTAYRKWRQDLAQDFDFTANPLFSTVGLFDPDLDQWTEELRVRSLDDSATLKWNSGLYFADGDVNTASGRTISDLPPPYFPTGAVDSSITQSKQEAQTYAIFGETTYTVAEHLDLTAGVRLTCDERQMWRTRSGVNWGTEPLPIGPFQIEPFTVRNHFSAAQPKFGVAYHFQPECEMYATVASGYQSGGFNASNDDPAQTGYNPARSWNYEVGVRTLWFNQRLEFNTAFFYTDTDGYQVYRLNTTDPTQAYLLNAARATSWGAEAELIARPRHDLTLSLNGGYTHAQFDQFYDPYNHVSFDGKTINFVPEFTISFAAEYRFLKYFYARGEVVGVGRYFLDEANTTTQNPYALLNARLGYKSEHLEIYLFGRKLLDEHYASNALDFSPSPGLILQPGDPLTFGAAITARF